MVKRFDEKRELIINAFIRHMEKVGDFLPLPPGEYIFKWSLNSKKSIVENATFKGGIEFGPCTGMSIKNNKFI